MASTARTIAPLQARSRESLVRMLDAAERILARKEFGDMSIAEIAAKAGVSVGNFYNRFPNKDALLEVLHERYERERLAFLTDAFARADRPDADLSARIEALTAAIVKLFRARRGVLRSLVLRYWRDAAAASPRAKERVDVILTQAQKLLLGARSEIRHRDPKAAVQLGLTTLLAVCREVIVLRPGNLPGSPALTDEALARELSSMLHAYLRTGGPRA